MTTTTFSFIECLEEDDGYELELHVYELIYEYLTEEMPRYSKSIFVEEMIYCIVEPIYELYFDATLCVEEDYDEIYEFVKHRVDVIIETILQIPPRSHPNADILSDKTSAELRTIDDQIEWLRSVPQPDQRTSEWYETRHNLITASNIGKLFSTDAQYNSLIYEKCRPLGETPVLINTSTNSPMHWGNKYEPLSVMIYEKIYSTKIGEFGCIQHPEYKCIGASPDGINTDRNSPRYGRMLEIKNIVNRDITGIPLEMYWIQMQIQMETCGLDECDFLETRFREYDGADEFYDDVLTENRGVVLYFTDKRLTVSSKPFYVYMDLSLPIDRVSVNEWTTRMKAQYRDKYVLFEPIFWRLDEISCVLVSRNRLWFKSAIPKILDAWNVIERERVEGYEHRCAKKRVPNNNNNNNNGIQPSVLKKGVCLIKLE